MPQHWRANGLFDPAKARGPYAAEGRRGSRRSFFDAPFANQRVSFSELCLSVTFMKIIFQRAGLIALLME